MRRSPTLGDLIPDALDLGGGTVSVLAPDGPLPDSFWTGNVLMGTGDASDRWAFNEVENAMANLNDPVVVGLEAMALRKDPWLDRGTLGERPRDRAWFFGEEVYWRYVPGETGWSADDVVGGTTGAGMNALSLVTERPSGVEGDLDLDQLRFLAERTRLIVVEIFDAEGYAIWRPAT